MVSPTVGRATGILALPLMHPCCRDAKQTTYWMETTTMWPGKHSMFISLCNTVLIEWSGPTWLWAEPDTVDKGSLTTLFVLFICIERQGILINIWCIPVKKFFTCVLYFILSIVGFFALIWLINHQRSSLPPTRPLHPFHSAGTVIKCSRPGNHSLINKNASILWLHFAKSGWVRAACRNSCSGSDQKKERDFFDY